MHDFLLGVAVGDAFGFGIEMQDRTWMQSNVDFTKYISVRTGRYGLGYRLGDYSDDTADTVAVMNALMSDKPFNQELLLEKIQEQWDLSQDKRCGISRAGYGSIREVLEAVPTDKSIMLGRVKEIQRAKAYPGNAPAMRAIPFGFLPMVDLEHYATVSANLTHPHPKGRAASIGVALASFLLRRGYKQQDIIKLCARNIEGIDKETHAYLLAIDTLGDTLSEKDFETLLGPQPIPNYLATFKPCYGLGSDAMRTLGAALYVVKHAKDAFSALKLSVNMGGDVDTLASVAVGLTSLQHGLNSLPNFLFDDLEDYHKLRAKASEFNAFCQRSKCLT